MIYIACPYWNESKETRDYRRKKAIEYSTILIRKGFLVYSPLLYTERFADIKSKEGYWIKHGIKMVAVCTEMHVLCLDNWEESDGVKGEIKKAQDLNLSIKYITEHTRLSFHGSRTLIDKKTKAIIELEIEKHQPSVIVTHGEPGGVCALSRKVAKEQGIPLKLHHLQMRYATGKFHKRSLAVLHDSDYAIFIHDGISKGTNNELELAKKLIMPHTYYKLDNGHFAEQQKESEEKQSIFDGFDDFINQEIDLSEF